MASGITEYFVANEALRVVVEENIKDLLQVTAVSTMLQHEKISDLMELYPLISPLMLANMLFNVRATCDDVEEDDNYIEVDV